LIEEGKASWKDTLQRFYEPFQSDLERAKKAMRSIKREGILTSEVCPECGAALLVRAGRYGLFIGCSSYPECGYTRNVKTEEAPPAEAVATDQTCPQCAAPMVIRRGRSGPFLSCSRYPECRSARPLTTGVKCPKCGQGELAQRRTKKGKIFYSCTRYPDCDYSLWSKPVSVPCPNPECDSSIMEERVSKRDGTVLQCPKCKQKIVQAQEPGKGAVNY
jgi:DNA topoisomerase-1